MNLSIKGLSDVIIYNSCLYLLFILINDDCLYKLVIYNFACICPSKETSDIKQFLK